jgi:hypothetical protein
MKKKKKQKKDLEDNKFLKIFLNIITILLILYGLWKLATTGGRGYDHFIGEPIEYRMPPQRK